MPSVEQWQTELFEIADRLEASAMQWVVAKEARDEIDEVSDRAGLLRSDGPWAVFPHAEVLMSDIVAPLRKIAAALEGVSDPPVEEDA